jgi:oligopeptide/dipeptide ABC transporter ATP-binding protein
MTVSSEEPLLTIRELRTHFFTSQGIVRAVDGIDLRVDREQTVGLVGESGCGKSTVAMTIMKLIPMPGKVISGSIVFNGKDLLKLSEDETRRLRGRELAMVFQDPMTYLNPVMKVGDQISECVVLHQETPKKDAKKEAIKLLEKVGIPSASRVVDYYPHQLSGGMRQRVLIAMALSGNPLLLIADEPTTALDVTVQAQILKLIEGLKEDYHSSLLLITHDLGIVASMCDKVYVMYAGKIVEQGDVLDLFENPKHPYTSALISCSLSIDEYKKDLFAIGGTVPNLINPPSGCRFHPRCPEAKDICHIEEPQPVKIDGEHIVSCWLHMQKGG